MKTTRRLIQLAFLTLTVVGVFVVRGNAERWCPFGGVEALYGYVTEGNVLCALAVTNFFMLGAVLVLALLVRRAFCAYACPIGTISEWLGVAGRRVGLRTRLVPARADAYLRKGKYVVLAIILYFTWTLGELEFRAADPCYALISRHGEDITLWAYVVAGLIVVGALVVTMPFCRWLCPLGAVLAPFSRLGFTRIRRDAEACSGCARCTSVCPTAIPVHMLDEVRAARCMTCFNCLAACPPKRGALSWGPARPRGAKWPPWIAAMAVLVVLSAAVTWAYVAPFPSFTRVSPARAAAAGEPAVARLRVDGVTCRGRATLLAYFLERDDEFAVDGFLKIEAWPGPGRAAVDITYDAALADADAIRAALSEAYFDRATETWRVSPFAVEGYDALGGLGPAVEGL
ncbi:MAG TPA: 4Fe-4S binding protein [Phycisphaerae bacterium]|nr:4Fe-4S binding protein [Phycisphaerae bacterium]